MEENRKQKPSDFKNITNDQDRLSIQPTSIWDKMPLDSQNSNDFKDINDNQERLFFQLSSIWDRKPIDSQKITRELHKLKLMQVILYPLIIFGIIAIFIFILQGINLLIITIDFIIVAIYLICLKYIYAFRKTLKITKKDSKHFIKLQKKSKNFSIFNLIILFTTIFIFIIWLNAVSYTHLTLPTILLV